MSEENRISLWEYLKAIPDIPKDERGKVVTVPCPCGGVLGVMRESYSGHLRCKCDDCGFRLIE